MDTQKAKRDRSKANKDKSKVWFSGVHRRISSQRVIAVVAVVSLGLAIYGLYAGNLRDKETKSLVNEYIREQERQYVELTVPHTRHDETHNKLIMLDNTIRQLRESDTLRQAHLGRENELERNLNSLENLKLEAEKLWNENQFDRADSHISEAYTLIEGIRDARMVMVTARWDVPPLHLVTIRGKIVQPTDVSLGLLGITVTFPEGTEIADEKGVPINSLTFEIDEITASMGDAKLVGPVYNFGPDGATFKPPITVVWNYNPANIPNDINETRLVVAAWDKGAAKWTVLKGSNVNVATNTISAPIHHFTSFAILVGARPVMALPSWSIHLWWGLGVLGAIFFGYWLTKRRVYYYDQKDK